MEKPARFSAKVMNRGKRMEAAGTSSRFPSQAPAEETASARPSRSQPRRSRAAFFRAAVSPSPSGMGGVIRCTTVGNTATPTTRRQKWTSSTLDASAPKSTAIKVTSEMPPGTAQTRQLSRSEYPVRNSNPPTTTFTSSREQVIMMTGL